MTEFVDRIHGIIADHRPAGGAANDGTCACGADGVADHSRHLAEEIARGLDLRRERLEEAGADLRRRTRYVSAWFDDELTHLEGAE
jgi:hypothetical protein